MLSDLTSSVGLSSLRGAGRASEISGLILTRERSRCSWPHLRLIKRGRSLCRRQRQVSTTSFSNIGVGSSSTSITWPLGYIVSQRAMAVMRAIAVSRCSREKNLKIVKNRMAKCSSPIEETKYNTCNFPLHNENVS